MDFPNLKYDCTNESIDSVVSSLSPQEGDNILAICGSGDIPFVLVEHARVTAVDIDEAQIDFASYRADKLKLGDYASFLREVCEPTPRCLSYDHFARDKYFSDISRMEAIRQRLGNLSFEVGNIFGMDIKYREFNKIYLSNALGYKMKSNSLGSRFMKNVSKYLLSPGLIYLANYYQLLKKDKRCVDEHLQFDFGLTRTASRYYDENDPDNWRPAVFRLSRNNLEELFCLLRRIF